MIELIDDELCDAIGDRRPADEVKEKVEGVGDGSRTG